MPLFSSSKPLTQGFAARLAILSFLISALVGGLAGYGAVIFFGKVGEPISSFLSPSPQTIISEDEAIIDIVEKTSPAVVSIAISREVPVYERYLERSSPFGDLFPFKVEIPRLRERGTERRVVGGGTGFFVSADGYVVTNRHVVEDEQAFYTVITADGKELEAKVLDRDPVNDLAVLDVEGDDFPTIAFGESDELRIGQRVIAIGYALGRFKNTVSVGVVSGLGRDIQASGGPGGMVEALEDLIQTDAAINPGNSGGPLIDLHGRVIGVNVAVAQGSQNIGFAIPVNAVKPVIESVRRYGRIIRPQLGVRYQLITPELAQQENLPVTYGAWLKESAEGGEAVIKGSPAESAGLKPGDIILEIDGTRIDQDHTLASLIIQHQVGDTLRLKVRRDGQELELPAVLAEWKR
ncbi:trypsin-like peptidase domain-containing protein [Candidatus Uhrbacteria bacterium]|nr:trypsin-like peptidase domain-containing protein [Candidatus Uhrbacteria bacterium]